MRIRFFILILGIFISQAYGSDSKFNMYRWNENYSYLANQQNLDWYQQLKYKPFAKKRNDIYVSLGGSLRERLNIYQNDLFDLRDPNDGYLFLHRMLLHADIHITKYFRTFVEIGSHLTGRNRLHPGPFDEDNVDFTQGFIDLKLNHSQLRIGRQEMKLGSARLLGVRDGPNVRRSFDGVSFCAKHTRVKFRLFALGEVQVHKGVFDNNTNLDESVWGTYSTWNFYISKVDIYYIGLYRGSSKYARGKANEVRHSIGTRFFGKKKSWDWNYEFIYQFGTFGPTNISAWTAASITGYSFKDIPWQPRIALSTNVASGDDDHGSLKTFNPLFPNLTYFEEAAVLSPQNFFNIEPEITVHPNEKLSISIDWNFFWRLKKNDAVYVRGLNPLPGTVATKGHFVTNIPSISIDCQLADHIKFDLSYSHYFTGKVIKDAGGHDINYIKLQATFTF